MQHLLDIVAANRAGQKRGIYAICTAHPIVLEAALRQGKQDGTPVLIEATANQVNQFGGYTGMKPADFMPYIAAIAHKVGFDPEQLILGGDHLGPVCWCNEPAEQAMAKADELIAAYVAAGFKKIHLDTSMGCADDVEPLSDEIVAERAARLCAVAEKTAQDTFGSTELVYVVGTEVPPPGGATEEIEGLQVTPVNEVRQTVAVHKAAFEAQGLEAAWQRVIGLVVQPGVEFDHTSVHDYRPEEARELSGLIGEIPTLVFEAHSTDYQPDSAYPKLVEDHFAILKVGPQLTYALREALFALSHIEDELVDSQQRSNLRTVCEQVMLDQPGNWQKYYPSEEPQGRLYRRYSYSDRIRYYWPQAPIQAAVERLFANLESTTIPEPLLGQYMPQQYTALRNGELAASPRELAIHQVMQVTGVYAAACR
ncbi:MAG: D-tagatose-bisphosphate aldolase, class II, non-catalytic subunit [Porticoccaceae bacterium]|nr:D-tagatose-bisphosphate aldolase, class II, non-catalytic subunit [Porticoccaceae bacterium]